MKTEFKFCFTLNVSVKPLHLQTGIRQKILCWLQTAPFMLIKHMVSKLEALQRFSV